MTISTPLPAVIRRTPSARPSEVRSITSSKPSLPALIAEDQRRLCPRMSSRQDRVIERGNAGGRNANQYTALCWLRLRQFNLTESTVSRKGLRFDRPHVSV